MIMKYIVMRVTLTNGRLQERPYIFTKEDVHADVRRNVHSMLFRQDAVEHVECVSAGFISIGGHVGCHGKSESLNIESRNDIDNLLLATYDRTNGYVNPEDDV